MNFLIFDLILMLFFTKCKVMSYLSINTKNELLWFYRNWAKCGWNSEILHTWKMYTIYVLHLILTCFNQCFFFSLNWLFKIPCLCFSIRFDLALVYMIKWIKGDKKGPSLKIEHNKTNSQLIQWVQQITMSNTLL